MVVGVGLVVVVVRSNFHKDNNNSENYNYYDYYNCYNRT